MANFVIIVDPDAERRSGYIEKIKPLLPPVEGLIINSCEFGDFSAIWAANPQAPISIIKDERGAAIIWGEPIPSDELKKIDATRLRNLWQYPQENAPTFDGFYAATVYEQQKGIAVGADIIGCFPVYYYTFGDVALVTSSPELLQYHPIVTIKFDTFGLVAILLTNGLINGRTLWQNVKRLDPGKLLVWSQGNSPQEIPQYQLPNDEELYQYEKMSFPEHLDVMEEIVEHSLTRQVPSGSQYSMLLSGGLDSRMFSGFLRRRNIDLVGLTLGNPNDLEMQCAQNVSRVLGMEHRTGSMDYNGYVEDAEIMAKWEHLSNGFGRVTYWRFPHSFQDAPPKLITGYTIGLILGGSTGYPTSINNLSFETVFNDGVNCLGITPALLEKLLDQEIFGDLVQEIIAEIRSIYESYSHNEFKRCWWFNIYHRQRFHVCCALWRISFFFWPIVPFLDWKLIKTASLLPLSTVGKRRGQIELVCTRFPQLGELPLDRNSFYIAPLKVSKFRQPISWFYYTLKQKWLSWQSQNDQERRYYFRIYDLNNPGWQEVRKKAEPYRDKLGEIMNKTLLNEMLPPPDQKIHWKKSDWILEGASLKSLVGLMLWSKSHNF